MYSAQVLIIYSEANGVSTTNCDPQEVDSGDADVEIEIVPDTYDERDVPHKKRHCLGTSETYRGGSEPLNLDACIVCEISDNRVSRCSGIDCLISFHGECLNAEYGGGDDLANSYCPYCWYKVLALKYKSAREKAVEAEKAVFKYLDKNMKSQDGGKENTPETQEDSILSGDENENHEHSVDGTDIVTEKELQGENDTYSRGEKTPLIEEINKPEEDKRMLEEDKSGDLKEDKVIDEVKASENEDRAATESFQDAEDNETAEAGAGKKGDASPFLSMQESFSGKEHDQVQQKEKRTRRSRRLILNTVDSDVSSNESTNERNEEDATEQIASSGQVTSPSGKMKNQHRKHSATTKVAKSKSIRFFFFFIH